MIKSLLPFNMGSFEKDEYSVHLYMADSGNIQLLNEVKQVGNKLIGPYTYRKDPPTQSQMQQHLHIMFRGNQIFTINQDGTAHDRSHNYVIPKKVLKSLIQRFSTF